MNKEEIIEYVKSLGGIETPEGWNVPTNFNLSNLNLTEIPIQFNIVQGHFWCDNNKLTSLKGCPKIVKGGFLCSYNKLTSLKYCPKVVEGTFFCYSNKLTSYKYAPKEVKGNFLCDIGDFIGKDYYDFLLKEKVITEAEYLAYII